MCWEGPRLCQCAPEATLTKGSPSQGFCCVWTSAGASFVLLNNQVDGEQFPRGWPKAHHSSGAVLPEGTDSRTSGAESMPCAQLD